MQLFFASALKRKLQALWELQRAESPFKADFERFASLSLESEKPAPQWSERFPQLNDATSDTTFDAHYIYHPAWAARLIARAAPSEHIDISSSLHFCSLISAWVPVRFFDFRPAPLTLSNLKCERADVTALPFGDNSIPSLSCMHVVEHIGLGRYGDPLDPHGDAKARDELTRVLAPHGRLYYVVPVGKPRIQFNAHRIYGFDEVVQGFPELKLIGWALLPDDSSGGLEDNPDPARVSEQVYGCGCFCFSKE